MVATQAAHDLGVGQAAAGVRALIDAEVGGREGSRDAGSPCVYERPRKGMSSTTRAMSITAICQTTPAEAWCIRESPTIPRRDLATDQLSSTNRRRIADEAPTNRR